MSNEAPQIQTPEIQTSAEKISVALAEVRRSLYGLTSDAEFQQGCLDGDIDPFDVSKIEYWSNVKDFANGFVEKARDNDRDTLRLEAFSLVASYPEALLALIFLKINLHGAFQYLGYI